MKEFLKLEAAYLIISLIVFMISIFVATRPFMPKRALKKAIFWTLSIIIVFIAGHYTITRNRILSVEKAFNENKKIVCESRMLRNVAQSITIQKSLDWSLKDNIFTSPNYTRSFHAARCIVLENFNKK